jgi:hypothetical protein
MASHDYNPNSMDSILARIEARQAANCEKLDHMIRTLEAVESRLAELERWKFWLLGAAAAVSGLVVAIGHLIGVKKA